MRNQGTVLQNNLSKGLITEATGLNFPENAVTDSINTAFEKMGRARRRKGIDIEGGGVAQGYLVEDGVVREFIWQSVSLQGGYTFLVLQIGEQILFYELSVTEALSKGIQPGAINLNDYKTSGNIKDNYCSFASGAGYLFITHPFCDPILVRFNSVENVFEAARGRVLIRDFEGLEDRLAVDENPGTLSKEHHYNLKNQGWHKVVRVGLNKNNSGSSQSSDNAYNYPLLWESLNG